MYRNYYKKLSATARAKLEKAKPGLTTEMHFLMCMGHQFFIIRYKGLNCFQLLNSYAQVLQANMLKARTGGASLVVPVHYIRAHMVHIGEKGFLAVLGIGGHGK